MSSLHVINPDWLLVIAGNHFGLGTGRTRRNSQLD